MKDDDNDRLCEEFDERLADRIRQIKQESPETIAFLIIMEYMQLESPSPQLTHKFHEWLDSDKDRIYKEQAMIRVFDTLMPEYYNRNEDEE